LGRGLLPKPTPSYLFFLEEEYGGQKNEKVKKGQNIKKRKNSRQVAGGLLAGPSLTTGQVYKGRVAEKAKLEGVGLGWGTESGITL